MSEKKFKIMLQGSDKLTYYAPISWLKDKLDELRDYREKIGWNDVTDMQRRDIERLTESFQKEVLIPKARDAILKFLEALRQERKLYKRDNWRTAFLCQLIRKFMK